VTAPTHKPHVVIACGGTIETALLPGRVLFLRSDFDLNVTAAVSSGALEFVTRTAMHGVSGRDVYHQNAQFDADGVPMHLSLGRADALVLYPATARILAECASGSVTDPVTRLFAFTPKERVAIAPAIHAQMDPRPYREHLERLRKLGCTVLGGDDLHANWASVKSWLVATLGLEPQQRADLVRLDDLGSR
jgi:phosphopantothenoylcysteine decarboxylase/phosphopantothenate--cysteine ligase